MKLYFKAVDNNLMRNPGKDIKYNLVENECSKWIFTKYFHIPNAHAYIEKWEEDPTKNIKLSEYFYNRVEEIMELI